ncbi:MAG: hypothetical protein ISR45_09380 [Rhodospirillales bacterium]|nr:hypothetical protein [Rhodospirillales bacterium]
MKILVFVFSLALGGYVISEIVAYNDPVLGDPFAGLTLEEINQDLPSLVVASGGNFAFKNQPDFEVMAVEEIPGVRSGTF